MSTAQANLPLGDDAQVHDLLNLLVRSMADRRTIKVEYFPKAGKTIGAADLAQIEKSLDRLIKELLRSVFNATIPRGRKLVLPVLEVTHIDDGKDSLIVTLDFEKILGKRHAGEP